jgi:hypothetical protein
LNHLPSEKSRRFHVVGDVIHALTTPKAECVTSGSAKAKRMTGQFSTQKKVY